MDLGLTNPEYQLVVTVGFFMVWAVAYFVFLDYCGPESNDAEVACRYLTLLHAAVIALVGYSMSYQNNSTRVAQCNACNSSGENFLMSLSLGFFIFDSLWCITYTFEHVSVFLHHVAVIILLFSSLVNQNSGSDVVLGLGASEFTSVILNLRWMLKHNNMYEGTPGLVIDFVYVLAFIVIRLYAGGLMLSYILSSSRCDALFQACCFAFYVLNCVFFAKIWSFSKQRLRSARAGRRQSEASVE